MKNDSADPEKPVSRRRPVRRSLRTTALRLTLAIGSIAVTLVAMDVGLRLLSIGTPRRGVMDPRPLPHRLTAWIDVFQPGYTGSLRSRDFNVGIRMNSLGLRERELDFDALAARHPCVMLGDSYFFGWGVELPERLSERLESILATNGVAAPVVNLSFPGWSTAHYLEIWRRFVSRLKPRLIIVSCFVGNDFTDDQKQAARLTGAATATPDPAPPPRPGLGFREALSTSPILGAIQHLLWTSPRFRGAFNRLEIRNDRIALYESEPSELQRKLYGTTESALSMLAGLARDADVPVLVVLIPDHLQVLSPDLFHGFDLDRPQREITAHLGRLGIATLDLLPILRAMDHPERLFFQEDKHWNAAGHAFVADLLAPRIRQLTRPAGAEPTRP